MSERAKPEYYAKHLEQQNPNEQMELFQPVSLPTLLARMVNEYRNGVYVAPGEPSQLVEDFNRTLLASAQPLLTEYLTAITTPPKFVAKEQQEEDEANLPMMVRALLAAERQVDYIKAEQAMEMARAGYPDLARKHLGLDEPDTDRQLAYREFCARLAFASPDAPTPSLEEWAAARKRLGLDDPHERDEAIAKTLSYRTYLMALPADQVAIPYQEWRKSLGAK